MLKINPAPYILCEAILVNLGATLFSISSIPNILIASYAGITFSEFFLSVGLISIVTLICTIMFFAMLYRKTLTKPDSILIEVLEDFNNWNVVSDRKLLKKSMVGLILLFGLFLTIPSNIIPLDIIALSIAILLSLISRLDPKDIIQKIDMDLILYLIGIFIVSGGLELTGVIELLGNFISGILGSSQLGQIILIMWVSAIASSNIDNIPITKVLVPIIGDITQGLGYGDSKILYYSLALGANWGDNLTPLGDNVLVMKIAEEQKSPITVKQFFKLGFVTTILQLMFVSVIFIIMYSLVLGLTILAILIGLFLLMRIITKKGSEKVRTKIAKISEKMRNAIIA